MVTVGTGKNKSSNQLPAWTSNRFAVFLEGDPAGLPQDLERLEGGNPPLRGEGHPARLAKPGTMHPKAVTLESMRLKRRRDLWTGQSGRNINGLAVTPAWK